MRADSQRLQRQQADAQRLQDQEAEIINGLARLNPQIPDVEQIIREKESEVKKFRDELRDAKSVVVKTASEVNKHASKEIIERVWELVPNFSTMLAGGASTGYLSVLFTNFFYNLIFYFYFRINIFDYLQIQDLAVPHLISLISLNILVWIFLIYCFLKYIESFRLPRFIELISEFLYFISKSLKLAMGKIVILFPLFILSSVIVPGTVAWWKADSISISAKSILSSEDKKDKVDVITVPSLRRVDDLVHIGSSSAHEFFLKNEGDKNKPIAIPLSGIVCIADEESGCEPNDTIEQLIKQIEAGLKKLEEISLKPEYNPWITTLIEALEENVTENGVRQYISQNVECGENQRVEVSKFILFDRNESDFDLDEEDERKNLSKQRERQKVSDFAKDWKEKATRWTVFGFASADGEQTGNNNLSLKRSEEVKKLLCMYLKNHNPNFDCDSKETLTARGLGEDQPINGVANSRSARIAVCVRDEAPEGILSSANQANVIPSETNITAPDPRH